MARAFYIQLYTVEPCLSLQPSEWSFPRLSHSDRNWLNRPVSAHEVFGALSEMGPHKAPGPDGFPPCLFQKYWHILGDLITLAIQDMFRMGKLTPGLNEAIICLLPKQEALDSLAQFRPISLCNVLLKLVSKILANCLKPLMSKLTGASQASFIPGRSTTDNIVVAQEVLHSLRRRKGRKGGFILKVDLEKAYDRVDWGFLSEVLKFTGFKPELIHLITDCFSSTKLAVAWNGETLDSFTPSRGLHQGDPLSPYLFVLCLEVLSQMIVRAVDTKRWQPIHVSRHGPGISHIFFADDLLLFGSASFSQARLMEHILASFCGFSGQRVSRSKSRVWFSPNTPAFLRHSICSEFHIPATANLGMYLGVPLLHGRPTKLFHHLINKANHRLAGWKMRHLSKAARLILIKFTLTAFRFTPCSRSHYRRLFSLVWIVAAVTSSGVLPRAIGVYTPLHGTVYAVPFRRVVLASLIYRR